ncbi:unnamed protein product [Aphanomyces euteiches]
MGNTPSNEEQLIQAAASGDLNNLRVLLENGADITFADTSRETALHAASRNGYLDIVKELIARDAPHDLVGWNDSAESSFMQWTLGRCQGIACSWSLH